MHMYAGRLLTYSRRILCLLCSFPSVSLCPLQYSGHLALPAPSGLSPCPQGWQAWPGSLSLLWRQEIHKSANQDNCGIPSLSSIFSCPSLPDIHCPATSCFSTCFVHILLVLSRRENLVLVIPSWLDVNVQIRPVFSEPFVKIFANIFTCETQIPTKL